MYLRASNYKNHWCLGCRRKNSRDWARKQPVEKKRAAGKIVRDRRLALIASKKDVPCSDCGIKYPPYVMDFDHVTGVKLAGIGEIRQCRLEILEAEMAKCEVVCANCHRERTQKRLNS